MAEVEFVPGLAGVPAARSQVGLVDGKNGKLQYRGYPVEVLARECTFEEVSFLLLFGALPTRGELDSFCAELAAERSLKFPILDVMKSFPPNGHPMDALVASVANVGMFYPGDHTTDLAFRRQSVIRLIAKLPTLTAAWHRIRRGDEPIAPRTDLSHAANFLYMLEGEVPDPLVARVFDVGLTLHAEHSMNASTFTCRVTGSTLANPYACVSSAIASLSGQLHGGANERVLDMLKTLPDSSSEGVRRWAEDRLARKDKIMGFGHRVYKVKDPRSDILQGLAADLFAKFGRTPIYDVATELESQMARLVGHKGIYPNVDFYSGIVYEKMGIPVDLFTPVFAIARVSGWLAHLLEQLQDNRIYRPTQIWTGEKDRDFPKMEHR